MKKISRKQKLIIAIAIVLIVIILAIVITTNIISTNKNLASEGYLATTANASSNLVASYIKSGITIGGITGTLETLDTSDADATPEDITYGKTAYVDGKKITGTYLEGVTVPDGFYYVGGTKDTGIIISDSQDDANKGDDKTASEYVGNQFVWVPVENPDDLFITSETGVQLTGVTTTTNIYSNLTIRSDDSSDYATSKPSDTTEKSAREPDLLSSYDTNAQYYNTILGFAGTKEMADSFVAEYKAMADSIKKYNGFYIGRYELTANGEKKGASLTSTNWYNLYKACQNVVQGKENVKSTMIYGVQWDAVCSWLKQSGFDINDSSKWGNYNNYNSTNGYSEGDEGYVSGAGSMQDTGYSEYWKANNIYDLAGNYNEWTQEAYFTNLRVSRRW